MITQEFLSFLADLKDNNNREWFHENKKRYETAVKKPFEQFVAGLIERLQIHNSAIAITPKEAIFRIYRDTRFRKDKTPYKTNVSAVVAEGGRKQPHTSGIYIEISNDRSRVYSGIYQAKPKQVLAIREAIVSDLEGFQELITAPDFVEKFGGIIYGEKHKRIPKEFRAAAEQQPLLFNKSFYFFHEFEAEEVLQPNFADTLVDYYLAARPLGDFLKGALSSQSS